MRDILYAPWRSEYTMKRREGECVFCYASVHTEEDAALHVLYRDVHCFMVMNKYPYTPGHIMIIPHMHTSKLEELSQESWLHICSLAQVGVKILKEGFGADGVNLGMNLGKAGGAGMSEHIHLHLVPRWERDTNFITSIAETRVYSTDFEKVYQKMKRLVWQYIEQNPNQNEKEG